MPFGVASDDGTQVLAGNLQDSAEIHLVRLHQPLVGILDCPDHACEYRRGNLQTGGVVRVKSKSIVWIPKPRGLHEYLDISGREQSSGTEELVSPGVREPQGNGEPGSGITEPQPGTVQVSYSFYETQSQAIALGMARILETY